MTKMESSYFNAHNGEDFTAKIIRRSCFVYVVIVNIVSRHQ